ncbi:MAG: methionine--tRNA ligase [Clostridia bacterium]|nr:methionine--tRNA ligase [Clostridia bacterium]
MSNEKKTFYITTPIYYTSGHLHIGNSYTTVAADTMARYKRMCGYDVMMLTGTDEHGQKVERKAQEAGKTPKEFTDEIVADIKNIWEVLGIRYDKFIRTSDDYHVAAVQKIYQELYDKGEIYKSEYEGLYCSPCEAFWTESQLVDGKCPDCGRPVEKAKEESYFFRLSKYQDKLIELLENNPHLLQPEGRAAEMINNFLKTGLRDLCVSRTTIKWGVPLPFDEKHVAYVWIDALSNYLTALGYKSDDDSLMKKYWPADIHLVGKDIVRFHTVIWFAVLMALGIELPKQVYGHGWLQMNGDKVSKSKASGAACIVDPIFLAEHFGRDAVRYFLLREMPFGSDGEYTYEGLMTRINTDLANDLGNLVSRTVAMAHKYFNGTIPAARVADPIDEELLTLTRTAVECAKPHMDAMAFSSALTEIFKLVSRANKYIDETAPWALAKDPANADRLATVMANLFEAIRVVANLLVPFMPDTCAKILSCIGAEVVDWDKCCSEGMLPAEFTVTACEALFPRIDIKKELAAVGLGEDAVPAPKPAKKEKKKKVEEPAPAAEISFEDFMNVELSVAKILECSPVEKSEKLLKLKVSFGNEERQIVSGIAKAYAPADLIGHNVVVVKNLKPAVIFGLESFGMILASGQGDQIKVMFADDSVPGDRIH